MLQRMLRIALIPLLLLGLGYGAQSLAVQARERALAYPGPDLGDLQSGRSTDPVARRVVVIVVDGLREDASHHMPTCQALRGRGADLPAWTELPAISRPGYTTLGTGAYPSFSGVTTNEYDRPVRLDNLFRQVQRAGRRTALVTMSGWDVLYGPWADLVYTVPWEDLQGDPAGVAGSTAALGQEARRVLQEEDVNLLYVHFGETDEVGHAYGGTSPAYLQAALRVDAQIAALAGLLDWSHDTLIVTADHGMTADRRGHGGGHGGDEPASRHIPLVMAGRGIAPGRYPDGGQADLVPTIAALLGLPIPAHSQGRTRLDALVLSPRQRAEGALALAEQQARLYQAYLDELGARSALDGLQQARAAFADGDDEQTVAAVQAFLEQLDLTVARAAANRLWQERGRRLPFLLLPLLAGALFLGLYRPRRDLLGPLSLAALYFLLYQGGYYLIRGHSLSFSSLGGMAEQTFFLNRILDALIALLVVAILAGIFWRRRPWGGVVWKGSLGVLGIGWALVVQLGLYLWLYGLSPSWRLPHLGWGFKFYLDLLATIGVGYAGVLFPWLILGTSRLFFLYDRGRDWWRQRRQERKG